MCYLSYFKLVSSGILRYSRDVDLYIRSTVNCSMQEVLFRTAVSSLVVDQWGLNIWQLVFCNAVEVLMGLCAVADLNCNK